MPAKPHLISIVPRTCITFNREQLAQLESRATCRLAVEIEQVAQQGIRSGHAALPRSAKGIFGLRTQTAALEISLRDSTDQVAASAAEQGSIEALIEELRLAGRQSPGRRIRARTSRISSRPEEAALRHTVAEEQRFATTAHERAGVFGARNRASRVRKASPSFQQAASKRRSRLARSGSRSANAPWQPAPHAT